MASGSTCVRPSGSAPTRTLPLQRPSLAAMSGTMWRSSASTRLKWKATISPASVVPRPRASVEEGEPEAAFEILQGRADRRLAEAELARHLPACCAGRRGWR
jgi:hypothetical protein